MVGNFNERDGILEMLNLKLIATATALRDFTFGDAATKGLP